MSCWLIAVIDYIPHHSERKASKQASKSTACGICCCTVFCMHSHRGQYAGCRVHSSAVQGSM